MTTCTSFVSLRHRRAARLPRKQVTVSVLSTGCTRTMSLGHSEMSPKWYSKPFTSRSTSGQSLSGIAALRRSLAAAAAHHCCIAVSYGSMCAINWSIQSLLRTLHQSLGSAVKDRSEATLVPKPTKPSSTTHGNRGRHIFLSTQPGPRNPFCRARLWSLRKSQERQKSPHIVSTFVVDDFATSIIQCLCERQVGRLQFSAWWEHKKIQHTLCQQTKRHAKALKPRKLFFSRTRNAFLKVRR